MGPRRPPAAAPCGRTRPLTRLDRSIIRAQSTRVGAHVSRVRHSPAGRSPRMSRGRVLRQRNPSAPAHPSTDPSSPRPSAPPPAHSNGLHPVACSHLLRRPSGRNVVVGKGETRILRRATGEPHRIPLLRCLPSAHAGLSLLLPPAAIVCDQTEHVSFPPRPKHRIMRERHTLSLTGL